ncbi:MAG: hypothetical protein IPQ23_21405 [Cytophagaceae bacterium]|nr:hypothetical protein [Cytophagaceae bacterium]
MTEVEKLEIESSPTVRPIQVIIYQRSLALYSTCCLRASDWERLVISTNLTKSGV